MGILYYSHLSTFSFHFCLETKKEKKVETKVGTGNIFWTLGLMFFSRWNPPSPFLFLKNGENKASLSQIACSVLSVSCWMEMEWEKRYRGIRYGIRFVALLVGMYVCLRNFNCWKMVKKLKSSLPNPTNLVSNFANLQLSDFSQALPVKFGKLSDATFLKSILV